MILKPSSDLESDGTRPAIGFLPARAKSSRRHTWKVTVGNGRPATVVETGAVPPQLQR